VGKGKSMSYIGNTPQNQGFTPAIDYFNGNGVTVTFTLSRPIASVAQVIVAVDNVIQNPSSAFGVVGNSITFTSAPLAGTNNIWVEYTSLITTYQGISQDPTVIGDIRATGGYLAEGDFGNSFVDGNLIDYVTGAGRLTVGELDDLVFYHGGTSARSEMMRLSYAGNSTLAGGLAATGNITTTGNVGIGTSSPSSNTKLDVVSSDTSQQYVDVLKLKTSNSGDVHPAVLFENNRGSISNAFKIAMDSSASAGTSTLVIRMKNSGGTFNTAFVLQNDGRLQFNSGYGSAGVAYGCRAWVNFNGTGTPAIRASGNVSSIGDLGTGSFQVNFITFMPDNNYSSQICSSAAVTNQGGFNRIGVQYGDALQLFHFENGSLVDTDIMTVAIFR
jgi:hypothetical protein